ncbi:MAG: hypothetical protein RLZZ169_1559 [Pseudomonadota bacterium]|jgi:Rod binding domain-containing protein
MANTAPIGSYYDFGGLARLRAETLSGRADEKATIGKVAAEFESAFYQMLLESMKKASEPLKSDLVDSDSMDQFQDMFYTEVSHFIANRQALGIAQWIETATRAQATLDGGLAAQGDLKR